MPGTRVLARVVALAVTLLALAATAAAPRARADQALRVAVLDFTNAAPDPAWDALGKGLQSMVTTDIAELAAGRDDLTVVERARLVDLQNELALGKTGALDPKTAAKIGKLAGATHLVAGSFTVVGGKMRLDARLITVQSGDVSMTATAEGDKDAFFELEKDLVKRLVDGAGVKMAPKERAKLAEIHTSDLEAFRAYSEGIAQFDLKKYDEALKNLEKAARLDDSFQLAKRTLAEYEKLAADARGHANAAHDAENERARLMAAQAASWDQAMLERLTKAMEGGKDALDKAIATSLLIEIFDPDNGMNGHFADMREKTDPFVLARMSDRFAQRYVADAKAIAPKIPLYPFETVRASTASPTTR
ncbi:MAG: CsgG/HfaB family protein [Myxococcota bacterium]